MTEKKVAEFNNRKVTFRTIKINRTTRKKSERIKLSEYSIKRVKANEAKAQIEEYEQQRKFISSNKNHILECYHQILARKIKEVENYRVSASQWISLVKFGKISKYLLILIKVFSFNS